VTDRPQRSSATLTPRRSRGGAPPPVTSPGVHAAVPTSLTCTAMVQPRRVAYSASPGAASLESDVGRGATGDGSRKVRRGASTPS
jgi:hypothetical protein